MPDRREAAPARRAREQAHARRIETMRRAAHGPLADYYAGYRAGMVRGRATAADAESRAREALAEAALRGTEADPRRLAWGCGYHDGQRWAAVTAHRGLLRLAIVVVGEGSARGFARHHWGLDEGNVRQMLAGRRPLPADHYGALLDLVASVGDRA